MNVNWSVMMTVDSWWSVDKLMMWKDGFTQLSATLRKNCWAMQNTLHWLTLEVAVKRFPFLESLAINPPFSKDCIGYILSGFEKVARGNIFVRERGKHRGGGKHRETQRNTGGVLIFPLPPNWLERWTRLSSVYSLTLFLLHFSNSWCLFVL